MIETDKIGRSSNEIWEAFKWKPIQYVSQTYSAVGSWVFQKVHDVYTISIPPTPSFSSLATPPETTIQEFIPKLRNMKIEMEFTLKEVCDYRDVVDLKHEHIKVLAYIIRRIELLRPH